MCATQGGAGGDGIGTGGWDVYPVGMWGNAGDLDPLTTNSRILTEKNFWGRGSASQLGQAMPTPPKNTRRASFGGGLFGGSNESVRLREKQEREKAAKLREQMEKAEQELMRELVAAQSRASSAESRTAQLRGQLKTQTQQLVEVQQQLSVQSQLHGDLTIQLDSLHKSQVPPSHEPQSCPYRMAQHTRREDAHTSLVSLLAPILQSRI